MSTSSEGRSSGEFGSHLRAPGEGPSLVSRLQQVLPSALLAFMLARHKQQELLEVCLALAVPMLCMSRAAVTAHHNTQPQLRPVRTMLQQR